MFCGELEIYRKKSPTSTGPGLKFIEIYRNLPPQLSVGQARIGKFEKSQKKHLQTPFFIEIIDNLSKLSKFIEIYRNYR